MKKKFRKFWLLLALTLTVIIIGFRGLPIWFRCSNGVLSSAWITSLNPHDGLENRLIFRWHYFRNVRGDFPGYMFFKNDEGKFAIFVTEKDSGKNVDLHFYNFGSRQDLAINISDTTGIGYTLGAKLPVEEIDLLTSSNCMLSLKDVANTLPPLQKTVYSINFNTRIIEFIRIDYTDLKGNILSNSIVK